MHRLTEFHARTVTWCAERMGARLRTGVFGVLAMTGLMACGGDGPPTGPIREGTGFWVLALNHDAITLSTTAPYDTIQLVATPLDANGDLIDGEQTTVFSSTDRAVTVTPTGLVTGVTATGFATITAKTTVGGVTMTSTAYVRVLDAASPVTAKSLTMTSTSPTVAAGMFATGPTVTATVLDLNDASIPDPITRYRSSNSRLISVSDDGTIAATNVGKAMIYASATVYGTRVTDSLEITAVHPLTALIEVQYRTRDGKNIAIFNPDSLTITRGADVVWGNLSENKVDVVFDDPAVVGAAQQAFGLMFDPSGATGNIPAWRATTFMDAYRVRNFAQPGTYRYRSALYNTHAIIVVK